MNPKPISTWLRVAFIFAFTMTALLLALSAVVTRQGRDSFQHTIQEFRLDAATGGVVIGPPISLSASKFGSPQDFFNDRFNGALIWITLVGILLSLLLGAVIAREMISKPLKRLQKAIAQLKNRNFVKDVDPTGLAEFDEVVGDFNELARELTRAEELRQNLISDTSHELKTPVTSLQVQLEGMRDGLIPLEVERVDLLLKQVDRLTDLIDRLQEYTRLRNRTASLKLVVLPVKELVEEVIADLASQLAASGIQVVVSAAEKLTIKGDKNLMEQVISNLILNTIRYSGAKKLTIKATTAGLELGDNGKGVPVDALPHIFERFYRVERSRNRSEAGLGLGLAIVREIIEAHGWSIAATNTHPGLKFTITW